LNANSVRAPENFNRSHAELVLDFDFPVCLSGELGAFEVVELNAKYLSEFPAEPGAAHH